MELFGYAVVGLLICAVAGSAFTIASVHKPKPEEVAADCELEVAKESLSIDEIYDQITKVQGYLAHCNLNNQLAVSDSLSKVVEYATALKESQSPIEEKLPALQALRTMIQEIEIEYSPNPKEGMEDLGVTLLFIAVIGSLLTAVMFIVTMPLR